MDLAMQVNPFGRYFTTNNDYHCREGVESPTTPTSYTRTSTEGYNATNGPQETNGDSPKNQADVGIFHLPDYLQSGPPLLAPGGGAEVLPTGMFGNGSGMAEAWFVNSGFRLDLGPGGAGVTLSNLHPPSPSPQAPPSFPLGLYSSTGFDLLSLLARISNRPLGPNSVPLGPVDLSCSFVIADVRRHDIPIVYVSPSFSQLTGYPEEECVGRNCRFLQSPPNVPLAKGEARTYTDNAAVGLIAKTLSGFALSPYNSPVSYHSPTSSTNSNPSTPLYSSSLNMYNTYVTKGKAPLKPPSEVQVRLLNWKKNGEAFYNLVSVIPVPEEDGGEVVWLVGFQVDLAVQPVKIAERVRGGRYFVGENGPSTTGSNSQALLKSGVLNAKSQSQQSQPQAAHLQLPPPVISEDLTKLLRNPRFVRSLGLGLESESPSSTSSTSSPHPNQNSNPTSRPRPSTSDEHAPIPSIPHLLLPTTPDFIHVLSLRGAFLYVAPSVRRVLGWEGAELAGRSLIEICYEKDVVGVVRELKEGSSSSGVAVGSGGGASGTQSQPPPSPTSPTLGGPEGGSWNTNGSLSSPNVSANNAKPKPISLLFRALTKSGRWIWIESHGRLHVEPGKGRKAIVLCGRARGIWDGVSSSPSNDGNSITINTLAEEPRPHEFWGLTTPDGVMLSAGAGVRKVLGWEGRDVIGKEIGTFVWESGYRQVLRHQQQPQWTFQAHSNQHNSASAARYASPASTMTIIEDTLGQLSTAKRSTCTCIMRTKKGARVKVVVGFYAPPEPPPPPSQDGKERAVGKAHLVYCIRLLQEVTDSGDAERLSDDGAEGYYEQPLSSGYNSPTNTASYHPGAYPGSTPHSDVSTHAYPSPAGSQPAGYHQDAGSGGYVDASGTDLLPTTLPSTFFSELSPTTVPGSSWQYELQQLRFRNVRLREEVGKLEADVEKQRRIRDLTAAIQVRSVDYGNSNKVYATTGMVQSPMHARIEEVVDDGEVASANRMDVSGMQRADYAPPAPQQLHSHLPSQSYSSGGYISSYSYVEQQQQQSMEWIPSYQAHGQVHHGQHQVQQQQFQNQNQNQNGHLKRSWDVMVNPPSSRTRTHS